LTILELVIALVAILGAAVLFTNAVEMVGERLGLGQGAVGSVLAAVGTALPETMIPVVALVSAAITGEGSEAAGEIGIGAILGAPFLLATLAMFVTGAGILGYQRRRRNGANVIVDERVISHDVLFFLIFFTIAAAAGVAPLPTFMRIVVAAVLVLAYVLYVVRTIRGGGGAELEEVPENLTLWPNGRGTPPTWAVWAQLVAALLIMVFGARTFVHAVEAISEGVGIPAGLIALVLAPLATELPEKFNSVIWVRDDKDTLALGNITGAMVFQSTLPVTLGILLTRWELGFLSIVSVVLALISGGFIYLMLRRKEHIHAWHLLVGGAFYAVFLVVALFTLL
jgi:cation:H+ antiporter